MFVRPSTKSVPQNAHSRPILGLLGLDLGHLNKVWHPLCPHEKILVPCEFKFHKNIVLLEPESVSIWTPCKLTFLVVLV